jgi:putative transposase
MRTSRVKLERASYYHVTSRALGREFIFDAVAAEQFVKFMRLAERFAGVRVITYCVMSNHFHLLVHVPNRQTITDAEMLRRIEPTTTPKAYARFLAQWNRMVEQKSASGLDQLRQSVLARMFDLSFFVKDLKYRFSMWFNHRNKRRGPLWEERFKSSLIDHAPGYLTTAAAYIDNNPVRAGIVQDPKDFRFCGYAAALNGDQEARAELAQLIDAQGIEGKDDLVLSRYRLLLFGKGILTEGRAGYSQAEIEQVFAAQGKLQPWELAKHRLRWLSDGAVIGSKAFVADVRASVRDKLKMRRPEGAHAVGNDHPVFTLRSLTSRLRQG